MAIRSTFLFPKEKMNGRDDGLSNGDDIVLVRKQNQQQLFTRTYNEDQDLKSLRMGGSIMRRYVMLLNSFMIIS